MLIGIYALVWVLVAAAGGILFAAGYFNETVQVVFAFLASALLFSGIVAILPWWVDRLYSPPPVVARAAGPRDRR